MIEPRYATILLCRCANSSIQRHCYKVVNGMAYKEESVAVMEEKSAYTNVFQIMTGRKPTKEELDSIIGG